MTRSVLVIEDDRDIAQLVKIHVADLGCEVHVARDGSSHFVASLASKVISLVQRTSGSNTRCEY